MYLTFGFIESNLNFVWTWYYTKVKKIVNHINKIISMIKKIEKY